MENSPLNERLQSVLDPIKSAERPEDADLIQDDLEAKKILVAWLRLPVSLKEPLFLGGSPQHKANRWKYAWKFRDVDFQDLAARAGLPDPTACRQKFEFLADHFLIYPDGTISKNAARVIARTER